MYAQSVGARKVEERRVADKLLWYGNTGSEWCIRATDSVGPGLSGTAKNKMQAERKVRQTATAGQRRGLGGVCDHRVVAHPLTQRQSAFGRGMFGISQLNGARAIGRRRQGQGAVVVVVHGRNK